MLSIGIGSHRKSPGFEVRAVIALGKGNSEQEMKKQKLQLGNMRNKLEQTVPGTFKAKYNITGNELVVTIKTDSMPEASSAQRKLHDFIKSVAKSLNIH